MLIHEIRSRERVFRRDNTIIVYFPGPRRVVSTARLNGGYREDLQAVFNHQVVEHYTEKLPGGSVEGYLAYLIDKLGLPQGRTAGLLTAASMENAAIKTASFRELEVTTIITGGVDVNGGRAGDPARHYELDGKWRYLEGTINILLFIDSTLPPHALVRAIVTATEAKSAALQELMAPSRYSRGIATGSGTDQIIAVSNIESPYRFSDTEQLDYPFIRRTLAFTLEVDYEELLADAPGTYGTGVELAGASSAWREEKDLAQVYFHGTGHVYGEAGRKLGFRWDCREVCA